MKITKLAVRNFRSLVDVELPLRDLTVVIGPNGAGKTALMEILELLHRGSQGELRAFIEERGGYQAVLSQVNGHENGSSVSSMMVEVDAALKNSRSGSDFTYRLETAQKASGYEIVRESLRTPGAPVRTGIAFEYEPERHDQRKSGDLSSLGLSSVDFRNTEPILAQLPLGKERFRDVPKFRRHLQGITFYSPLDVTNRSPVRLPQALTPATAPGAGGETLYSALYNLRTNQPEIYDRLLGVISQAFSGLKRLEFPVVGAGQVTLAWYDRCCRQPFYPNQLSEGTLRFLWLATVLMTAEIDSMLLIDEPELSLHPELIRLLALLLQEAAMATQIFVSTHSSDLIGWLRPQEVLVADKEDGKTRFTWADTLELNQWLAEYTLRDLWLMGNLGGRP
jgi:predicted ATPase